MLHQLHLSGESPRRAVSQKILHVERVGRGTKNERARAELPMNFM